MNIEDNVLITILDKLVTNNATPLLVGGSVRDSFLGLDVKDYDIEVYGLESLEQLEKLLEEFGEVNLVGKCFGIVKLSTKEMEYDFSFPRLENKTALGHRGFDVIIDSSLDFKEASKRRDFTINAIGYDYKNKIYLDPYFGIQDIKNKLLKHIDQDTFVEDPLRVYRAVQFSARFDFKIDLSTWTLCKQIVATQEFQNISKERIYEEYKKLLLKSKKPSLGFDLFAQLSIVSIDQNSLDIIDELAQKKISDEEKLLLMWSCMKTLFTKVSDDKKMLRKIEFFLSFKIPRIYADQVKKNSSQVSVMLAKVSMMKMMPKPLFMGKDLIKMGYKPNEKFKTILDTLYKMQLDGKI